jgi:hypothetical protein
MMPTIVTLVALNVIDRPTTSDAPPNRPLPQAMADDDDVI